MSAPTATDDEGLGNLLEAAKASNWRGDTRLPVDTWVRLGETDYEVMQHSETRDWVARWRVGRLSSPAGAADIVRVDLGVCWARASVIADGVARIVHDACLPGSDSVFLKMRYAPVSVEPL